MKKIVILLLCVFSACTYTAPAWGAEVRSATIDGKTSDRVHLREQPSQQGRSLGLYFTGTEVQYDVSSTGEWTWVNVGTQSGYVKSEYLVPGNGSVQSRQPIGVVTNVKTTSAVNLRSDASQDAAILGSLRKGDRVTVLGETVTQWYYVNTGGELGYVFADFLQVDSYIAPNAPSVVGQSPAYKAALASYKRVLQNQAAFSSSEDGRTLYVSQITEDWANGASILARFSIIDLDRDGLPEVVVQVNNGGYEIGYEILHEKAGAVYGYGFGNRAFNGLLADGTFGYSNGAADNGIASIRFTADSYVTEEITYCESANDSNGNQAGFYVDHKRTTSAVFLAAMRKLDDRPQATWYDFTDANIEAALSGVQ